MNDIVNNSIRYWEPRRVAFNAVLALVVAGSFFLHQSSPAALTWQPVIGLLLAAVLANVLYCAAYAADLLVQLSDYQAALATSSGVALGGGNSVCRRNFSAA